MGRFGGKASKIVLIALFVALIASIVLTAVYFIPRYRLLDKYTGLPVDSGDAIHQALDGLTLTLLISEHRVRNDGAYPSIQYLTEIMAPDHPMFYDKVYILSDKDDPTLVAWPKLRDLHIWPGYTCVHEPGGIFSTGKFRFTADEIDYEGLIEKDPGELAFVMVTVPGIIERAPRRDHVYTCSQFRDGDDSSGRADES